MSNFGKARTHNATVPALQLPPELLIMISKRVLDDNPFDYVQLSQTCSQYKRACEQTKSMLVVNSKSDAWVLRQALENENNKDWLSKRGDIMTLVIRDDKAMQTLSNTTEFTRFCSFKTFSYVTPNANSSSLPQDANSSSLSHNADSYVPRFGESYFCGHGTNFMNHGWDLSANILATLDTPGTSRTIALEEAPWFKSEMTVTCPATSRSGGDEQVRHGLTANSERTFTHEAWLMAQWKGEMYGSAESNVDDPLGIAPMVGFCNDFISLSPMYIRWTHPHNDGNSATTDSNCSVTFTHLEDYQQSKTLAQQLIKRRNQFASNELDHNYNDNSIKDKVQQHWTVKAKVFGCTRDTRSTDPDDGIWAGGSVMIE